MQVTQVRFVCMIAVLTLLFASSVLAKGLTLSLSDPELGSIVLKKENPIKELGGGLGGLSMGEFTYNGESLQMHVYRGEPVWHGTSPPELRRGYEQEYQMDIRVFDQDGTFTRSGESHLPPYEYFNPYDRYSSEVVNELQQRREALYIKMTALLKKNFEYHPDWWPEMHCIIVHGNVFEETRKMKKLSPPPPLPLPPLKSIGPEGAQLVIQIYKGGASELPAFLAEHSATAIWQHKARTGEWWRWNTYPNHGRNCEEGMTLSDTCYGVIAPPPLQDQVECKTPYGIASGQQNSFRRSQRSPLFTSI